MSEKVRSHHKPTLLEETRSPLVRFCHRAIFGLILFVLVVGPLAGGGKAQLASTQRAVTTTRPLSQLATPGA